MVIPAPDQKVKCTAELLVKEVVPMFGVPEALLSGRGTNLISCLMQDVCKLPGEEVEYHSKPPSVQSYGGTI